MTFFLQIQWGLMAFLSMHPPAVDQIDYCKVYGSVYEVEYPNQADVFVYEEYSEAFAKLIVFEENNRLMADKEGKWYFTDNPDFADFKIYFVDKRNKADISVYFTNFESFAGCSQ